jgi:hypothetical protein
MALMRRFLGGLGKGSLNSCKCDIITTFGRTHYVQSTISVMKARDRIYLRLQVDGISEAMCADVRSI